MFRVGDLFWLVPTTLVAAAIGSTVEPSREAESNLRLDDRPGRILHADSDHAFTRPDASLPAVSDPFRGEAPRSATRPLEIPFFGTPPSNLESYFGALPPGAPPSHPTSPRIPVEPRHSRRD